MAENTKIQWTTHTANLWWGCTVMWNFIKWLFTPTISYAEAQRRYGEHKIESDVMVLELQNHMDEVYQRHEERKKEEFRKQMRIESMFFKQKRGLVSDEEFKAFLLEEH